MDDPVDLYLSGSGPGSAPAYAELFQLFMRHLPGVACIKDPDGRYLFINDTWQTVYRHSPAQTLGRLSEEVWPADMAAQYRANDRRVSEGGETVREIEITPGDDGLQYWLCHKFPIANPRGGSPLVGAVAFDVTDRVRLENKLRRANRVLAVLSGINNAIVRIHDRKALMTEACRIAVELGQFKSAWVGLANKAAGGIEMMAIASEGGADTTSSAPPRAIAGSALVDEALGAMWPVVRDAAEFRSDPALGAWAANGSAVALLPLIVDGTARGVIGLLTTETDAFNDDEMRLLEELSGDVSFALDYIDKEERLAYLAYFDAMTDLPNRTLFLDRLGQLLHARQAARSMLGVIAFDIERFSTLNTTLGRHAGDAILRQFGQRLRTAVGAAGQDPAHVARIGADSFAVLVTVVQDEGELARILERDLLPALREPFQIDGKDLRISVKAGISLFPNDGLDAEALFRNAETSLRRAEACDRRYLFYTDQMQARIAERLSLENRLRRALAAGEFVLHYQPKMNLGSGRLAGLEALIRWNDPEGGLRSACDFVPVLEETGLVVEAGAWALHKALDDYQAWAAKGLRPPRVAVNVSPAQLGRRDFVPELAELIGSDANVPPGLDLEILESTVMENVEDCIAKLKQVRAMGVGVAIDDFGTGYSSLAYIAKLPMSAIKIDRSFITSMASDPNDVAVVTSIISLAHAMSVKVIAEGVDSDQQSTLLRLLRCDEAQGFLFSPALPPERIEHLLAAA